MGLILCRNERVMASLRQVAAPLLVLLRRSKRLLHVTACAKITVALARRSAWQFRRRSKLNFHPNPFFHMCACRQSVDRRNTRAESTQFLMLEILRLVLSHFGSGLASAAHRLSSCHTLAIPCNQIYHGSSCRYHHLRLEYLQLVRELYVRSCTAVFYSVAR